MQVTVRFTGPFRKYMGGIEGESLVLSLEQETTVHQALCALGELLGSPFVAEVVEPLLSGAASGILLLNRRNLRLPGALESALHEGDVLSFVPPMGGG
ncbi:MAG: MoaD/ThiS family protein [Chloroflexota bacterium]|nr:MoaD/ThiS family protein [Chloroflexota bacterium]